MKLTNILFIVLIVIIIICIFSIFSKKNIEGLDNPYNIEGLWIDPDNKAMTNDDALQIRFTSEIVNGQRTFNISNKNGGLIGHGFLDEKTGKLSYFLNGVQQAGYPTAFRSDPLKSDNNGTVNKIIWYATNGNYGTGGGPGGMWSSMKKIGPLPVPKTPDISGKWYGLDLMGGAINITQNGNKITATYGAAFDPTTEKIVDEGDGSGTIDGDTITFKWKNSDTPMTGKIMQTPAGFKYDYHNFGYSFGRTWPNAFKQNLSTLTGTLDQCYKACDENRLCTGFARHGNSQPTSTSQECELKTNAGLFGNQNALYLNLNTPKYGMVWGYGCNAPDGKTIPNQIWCMQSQKNDEVYFGKLDGTKKQIPPTITGIQWNNKLQSVWTRQEPAKPQFPFPQGYTENPGTCGVSEKTWDDISQKYYFKHATASQDLGDKSNQECAKACNDDNECYAFQNIHSIQPSPCKLFYEKVTEFGGDSKDASLDKSIKENTSCYVKINEPPLPPPKIKTPRGYVGAFGCCGNVDATPPGSGAEFWSDSYLATYSYKTASECASICNNDKRCGAFSVNRLTQPSECTIWPKGYRAEKGRAYGQVDGCEKAKSCYRKVIPASLPPRVQGTGNFAPPLPVKTYKIPKPNIPDLPPLPKPEPKKPQPNTPGVIKPINPLIPGKKKPKESIVKFNYSSPLPKFGPSSPNIPMGDKDTLLHSD